MLKGNFYNVHQIFDINISSRPPSDKHVLPKKSRQRGVTPESLKNKPNPLASYLIPTHGNIATIFIVKFSRNRSPRSGSIEKSISPDSWDNFVRYVSGKKSAESNKTFVSRARGKMTRSHGIINIAGEPRIDNKLRPWAGSPARSRR